jgi:tRNA pseudouridine32 synthase/23S rRNA pseudouridine746 synthase/23S rRNA pseudouridine1911/1915/1917 synthase
VDTWLELRDRNTIFEDDAILVINKPAGISLVGERHGTDLLKLAKVARETVFPVHRVDKVTSGLILFAKSLDVHGGLTRQFAKRTVEKSYLAISRPAAVPDEGTIDLPLMTASSGRVRVAAERNQIWLDERAGRWSVPAGKIYTHVRTYPSRTTFRKVFEGLDNSLVAVRPVTGRRHQIRVHLAWVGYPIEGDPLFDKHATEKGMRTALHSWSLKFDAAWLGGRRLQFYAPPGDDFWTSIAGSVQAGGLPEVLDQAHIEAGKLQDRYQRALIPESELLDSDGGDL